MEPTSQPFLEWITRIEAAAKQLKDPVSFSPRTIAFMKSEGSVFTTLSAHAPDAPWEEVKRELASPILPSAYCHAWNSGTSRQGTRSKRNPGRIHQ